jgi:hypothetical protein
MLEANWWSGCPARLGSGFHKRKLSRLEIAVPGHGCDTKALAKILSRPDFPAMTKVVAQVMTGNMGAQRVLLNNGFTCLGNCYCQQQDNQVDAKFYIKEITI